MSSRQRLSIAMTTYNGARFLPVQLASFESQSRQPDQLVVCDDGSTDSTIAILDQFARSAPFEVKVVRNAENLGHERNFGKAISLAEGDIIMLADQDDEWLPNKLSVVEHAFSAHPGVLLVANNVMITDERLVPTGRTVIEQMRRSGLYGKRGQGLTLGCATSFRRQLLELASPIPALDFGHDSWVHELAHALDSRLIVPEVLQLYRRHGANASNWGFDGAKPATPLTIMKPSAGKDLSPIWKKRERAFALIGERLRSLGPQAYGRLGARRTYAEALAEVDNARDAVVRRMAVFGKGRTGRMRLALSLLLRGDYRHFLGWRSFLKDLIR
ncbi:glycosyltransferase family 2 protein [Sphingomonas mesophila]|uniref:glycosyltransferase family 2 protein n=1 Tax=Sphingomonas mesophila TaxID=2303576 RepID=UPI000E57B285|nr:glycosyltransferase family 2 protein [Sphingomonas mesophila]